jgi:restriction system protein
VVRDFRGAVATGGERAADHDRVVYPYAQAEASRDCAPPVELIDGNRLCDLLKGFRLGDVCKRIAEDVTVNRGFL